MGHDIYAFKKTAYLRRSMHCEDRKEIYTLLDCLDCYGDCSGIAVHRMVEIEKVKEAIKLCLEKGLDEQKEFLQKALDSVDKGSSYILFYFG